MATNKKSRLGRGLDNLISRGISSEHNSDTEDTLEVKIPDNKPSLDIPTIGIREIELKYIIPNVKQARHTFDENAIRELADSIKHEGLLQPIIVRSAHDGYFSIVAGERRFRALQLLGKTTVLARITDANERDCAVISLIENLQRESLNPVEEALGFAHLSEEYGFTQEQIAQRVGKARTTIANSMRLLNLEKEALHYLESGQITVGHAKILLGITDPTIRTKLLEKIIEGDLNIRQTERQAAILRSEHVMVMPSTPRELSASLIKIEKQISQQLAANVSLQHGSKHGKIVIEYNGEQELLRIIQSMGIES